LLAQKGAKTIVFEPAFCVMAKKGTSPNACLSADRLLPAYPSHPSLGKEAYALFTGWCCALRLIG